MKLETAKRKLWPHRHRWRLKISTRIGGRVSIEAITDGDVAPERFRGPHFVDERGLANAMNRMAEKLSKIEDAIRLKEESDSMAREASRT